MSVFPLIAVGTYEEFILGYNPEHERGNRYKLHQTFASHSHQASIRCVATHKNLMASSGADEYINIYDMLLMEVSTVINYHDSTVTCLEFTPDGSHLVTANQNGDIAIFRCRDWTLVKLWKEAHKHANGVTSTSIHPSGSLLLTTGADNIVRFWNLVKGRQAYATNFSKKCSVSKSLTFGVWSKNGKYYAISIGNELEVYKTESAAIIYQIQTKTKIVCSVFIKKNLVCVATEDGTIEIHSLIEKKLLLKHEAHKCRIKSLASFSVDVLKDNKTVTKTYLVTADSIGGIKLWHFKKKGLECSLFASGTADCGCRITCLTMVEPKDVKKEESDNIESTSSKNVLEKNNIKEQIKENGKKTPEQNSTMKNKLNNVSESQSKTNNLKRSKNEMLNSESSKKSKFLKKKNSMELKSKKKKSLKKGL